MKNTSLSFAVASARALGHPARLRTVAVLRSGELCVCQITEMLGLAPSTVSAHLKELRQAGLTTERKQGRWVFVTLADEPSARPWIDSALTAVAGDQQITADAALVEELRRLPVEELCRLGLVEARARQASRASRGGGVGT
jgi:arsenate reductase/ArsR family transcriptional regulator